MPPDTAAGLLQVITGAVTPAVMISADAALILGINQKHAALADRVRALAVEYRAAGTSSERRESIRQQVGLFARRLGYAGAAHIILYVAVLFFVAMVPVIALGSGAPAQRVAGPWDGLALGLFVVGVALTLGAVFLELMELRLAGVTIRAEIEDLLRAREERPAGDGGKHEDHRG